MDRFDTADLSGCLARCRDAPACVALVFEKWSRRCFLKRRVATMRFDPKYVAALRPGTAMPHKSSAALVIERYPAKAFPYRGHTTRRAATYEDCAQRCREDASCVALTYFYRVQQCRLMERAEPYILNPDADSGMKRQPAGR
jgi:hypothetical protein